MLKFEPAIAYKRIGRKKALLCAQIHYKLSCKKNFFNIKLKNLPFWKVDIVIKLPKIICLLGK